MPLVRDPWFAGLAPSDDIWYSIGMKHVVIVLFAMMAAVVAATTEDVVRASSFGFDSVDSTDVLQKALDSGAKKIVIDAQASPWITRPLFVRSNCEIVFERGAEVVAKKGEFLGKNDSLFTLKCCENVKISGYGAVLRMHRADYAAAPYVKAEWRMSLNLLSCRNVTIEGLTLVESGGDGVYLGVARGNGPCRDIVLRDIVCDRHYRQGISVISARNLLIERCTLRGTGGTAPAAGIDFEPNRPSEELSDIVMRDCIVTNNHGAGIQFYLGQLNASSKPVSVKILNCRSTGNSRGFWLGNGHARTHVRGSVTCENSFFATKNAPATYIPPTSDDAVAVSFKNCRLIDFQALSSLLGDAPARREFNPAAAHPFDARPGEVVHLKPFRFRNGVTYRFYMAAPGEAKFSGRFTKVGKPDFKAEPVVFKNAEGKTCATVSIDGTDETPFSFKAEKAGFYTMTASAGSHAFGLSATSVPIAVVPSGSFRSIYATTGTLFFRAAENTPFVVAVSGDNAKERVRAKVADPSGNMVWEADQIFDWTAYSSGKRPATGLWRVTFAHPTGHAFEDFSILLQGAVPEFFLTPEKCW